MSTPTADPASPLPGAAYVAAEGFLAELLHELGDAVTAVHGDLVLTAAPPRSVAWAADAWLAPWRVPMASIGEGARWLRERQRNWAHVPVACHRRAALVAERLPHVSAKALRFPEPPPRAPLGAFALLDEHTLLASPRCASPVPGGAWRFEEDRAGPPNRAYLKLWESLTRLGRHPGPGERCLDLGASPGGFTWVLAGLGASVLAVDKAPLDAAVAALPGVEQRQESAFALEPAALGPFDWIVCDVVCYPARLLELVRRWLAAGTCPRFVCTLKFQGETDHASARAFAAIPGSRLVHLHHNKHELTWMLVPDAAPVECWAPAPAAPR